MKALILAGGFATRLWPLTEKRAKPLIPINGKPIISHIVEKLPPTMPIIVSTNKVFEHDFHKWQKNFPHRNITIVIEDSAAEEFKKGALGASAYIIQKGMVDEDLLLIAGDNLFDFQMQHFLEKYNGNPILAAHDVKEKHEAKKYGVVITQGENVIDFQEKPDHPRSTLASTGCYIFPKGNLHDIVRYAQHNNDDLGGIFEHFLSKGDTVNCFAFDEPWYDIGSFSSYLAAHKKKQQNRHIIRQKTNIDHNSEIRGAVFIGEGAKIRNCVIQDSIIFGECELENCIIKDSIIDHKTAFSNIDLLQKVIRQGITMH